MPISARVGTPKGRLRKAQGVSPGIESENRGSPEGAEQMPLVSGTVLLSLVIVEGVQEEAVGLSSGDAALAGYGFEGFLARNPFLAHLVLQMVANRSGRRFRKLWFLRAVNHESDLPLDLAARSQEA